MKNYITKTIQTSEYLKTWKRHNIINFFNNQVEMKDSLLNFLKSYDFKYSNIVNIVIIEFKYSKI